MKPINLFLFLAVLFFSDQAFSQHKINGSFEELDQNGNPVGWDLSYYKKNTYTIKLDSLIKTQGKYSVSISSDGKAILGNAIVQSIQQKLNGRMLSLVGSIRTKDVSDGWAGLWLRVDGIDTELAYDMMENQGLKGSQDWKEYIIQVPYDRANAKGIHFGALLTGKGKIWVDSLRLYLDDILIQDISPAASQLIQDTLYEASSRIDTIQVSPVSTRYLSATGKIWAFLKYHHPAITAGKYDWDQQLFEHLPKIIALKNDSSFCEIMEKWIEELGPVPQIQYKKKHQAGRNTIALEPDYGGIFSDSLFSNLLRNKLQYILENSATRKNHYLSFNPGAGNPVFENEKFYDKSPYPDAGLRLLALYRYWSMIQYFCPYRKLTGTNWNDILSLYIPDILNARDKNEYNKVLVRMICSIRDSHGFLSNTYHSSLGKYRLPFHAQYIEDRLVVTKMLSEDEILKKEVSPGDVIEKINGKSVQEMIRIFSPYTPGSNFDAMMRDMPGYYLLRSDSAVFRIELSKGGVTHHKTITGLENDKINENLFYGKTNDQPFYLVQENIGYVQGNKLKQEHMDSLKRQFASTKGMIIDMRGYPIDNLITSIGQYIRDNSRPFYRATTGSMERPGQFSFNAPVSPGKKSKKPYQGKIVVLVNEVSQSNAEFVTMAFQTSERTMVIGSSSAGADGNISRIVLPGGFTTYFSGIGIYYPDLTIAQQTGVKIDQVVRPTISGIAAGRDELLEKAKEIILEN